MWRKYLLAIWRNSEKKLRRPKGNSRVAATIDDAQSIEVSGVPMRHEDTRTPDLYVSIWPYLGCYNDLQTCGDCLIRGDPARQQDLRVGTAKPTSEVKSDSLAASILRGSAAARDSLCASRNCTRTGKDGRTTSRCSSALATNASNRFVKSAGRACASCIPFNFSSRSASIALALARSPKPRHNYGLICHRGIAARTCAREVCGVRLSRTSSRRPLQGGAKSTVRDA